MKKLILGVVAVAALIVAGLVFGSDSVLADGCLKQNITVLSFDDRGGAIVKNTGTGACEVFLASYEIHPYSNPQEFIRNQRLFDSSRIVLWGGETGELIVDTPACEYQLDIVNVVKNPPIYQSQEFMGVRFGGEGLCGQATPRPTPTRTPTPTPTATPTPTLTPTPSPSPTPTPVPSLSCSPEFRTVLSGQYATFTANSVNLPTNYAWNAVSGDPSSQSGGAMFTTRFFSNSEVTRFVSVASGGLISNCIVRVLPNLDSAPFLSVSKTVRNLTTNSGETENVVANPSDTVEFVIRVMTGNAVVSNVRVSDVLPSQLTYVSGSTTVNNVSYGDGLTTGGVGLGSYGPFQTITVRFRALVAGLGSFGVGTTQLTNTAYAWADSVSTVSDTATVSVIRSQADANLSLSVTKFGRNLTRGQAVEQTSVSVSNGNTVEFVIRVRSLSSVTLTNVIVTDLLPAGVEYLPRTASLNNVVVGDTLPSGLNIGSLAPGQEALIRFSGRINAVLAFPSGALTVFNTVQARADNAPTVSAQLPITLGSVAGISTGSGESVLLALVLSGLITTLYAAYTQTGLFKNRLMNFHRPA